MWGETKAPARGYLRAQFFNDQGVGQGGQLCQMENGSGFKGFSVGGFRRLASGQGGFRKVASLASAKESSMARS